MAQYKIRHSCGHDATVQIYGTNVSGERERKAEWLATQPCTNCARAERMTDNELRNMISAEQAAVAGLPALEGTPKQVRWATTIRQDTLDSLRASLGKLGDALDDAMGIYQRIAARETSAGAWIDAKQGDGTRALLKRLRTPVDEAEFATIVAAGRTAK
jgi:hypothetical protein